MHNYRIPYPSAPEDEATEGQQFVCARAFLVLVNILFFVIGFAAVVTSIAVAAKPERCEVCHSVLNLLLTFGLVCSFIAAFGIYGALSNSYKMLLVYVTFVAFLFMVQMVVFFWPLFGRFNFQRRMHTVFREKMRHHPQQVTELLNLVQRKLPCCGVDGPRDYHSVGLQLPLSCCASTDGSGQCAVRNRPTGSTTPLPTSNATEETANATASFTAATGTSTSTAPPAMGLMQEQLLETEDTTPEGETPPDADDATTELDETSTAAEKTATEAREKTTEDQKTPTDAGAMHREEKKTTHTTEKAVKTPSKPEKKSPSEVETSEEEALTARTTTEADESSKDEYSWSGVDQEEPGAEAPYLDVGDALSNARRKRSVTDVAGASPEPGGVTAGLDGVTPGNASMIVYNSTGMINGNFSFNATDEVVLEELLSNRTNLTGGPEPWDIRHVKMRGCYSEVWQMADKQHGFMVAVTVGAAALLSLQLVVLCTAHHVARGDFIQHG